MSDLQRRWIVILFAAVQFLLVSWTFPLTELLSGAPLLYIDAPFHWYRMEFGVDLISSGKLRGYEPMFSAGFLGGIYGTASNRLALLLLYLTDSVADATVVWKCFSFGSAIVGPVAVFWTVSRLAITRVALGVTGIVLLGLWWESMFRWFHTAGMVSFVVSAHLSIAYVYLAIKALRTGVTAAALVGLSLAGAFLIFLHPLAFFPVAFGMLACLLVSAREQRPGPLLKIYLVMPILILLLSLFWIWPTFFAAKSQMPFHVTYQAKVSWAVIFKEFLGMWGDGASGGRMYTFLALGALFGALIKTGDEQRLWSRLGLLAGIGLTIYAHQAGALKILAVFTQPNRFAAVAYLFFIFPFVVGVDRLWSWSSDAQTGRWRGPKLVGAAGMVIGLAACLLSVRGISQQISYGDGPHIGAVPPEVRGIGPISAQMLRWLDTSTSRSGRVLFEQSLGRVHDGGNMAGFLAWTSDREFIGGPYPKQHYIDFWDGTFLGQPIASFTDARFAEKLRLYNIGWAIVHTDESREYLRSHPDAVEIAAFGPVSFHKFQRTLSYVLDGKAATVLSGPGKIELAGISGDKLVLSYHLIPGLKATPDVVLEPTFLGDDPNPFIQIRNPPASLILE